MQSIGGAGGSFALFFSTSIVRGFIEKGCKSEREAKQKKKKRRKEGVNRLALKRASKFLRKSGGLTKLK